MFVDTHCHLDRLDLAPYDHCFKNFMAIAEQQGISQLVSISVDLESYPNLLALVADYPQIYLSVGVHPNEQGGLEPSVDDLVSLARNPKVIGIGETGLDYYRSEGDLAWQQQRFRNHIQAAKQVNKPLIIHTREAREDTIKILQDEKADTVGGVIHCFTEDWTFAEKALDLNFYISFSGIVTFNNAKAIQEVAQRIPADRFLIETDSPYLAPVPYRGKPNYPHYVRQVAEKIAQLREIALAEVAELSTANFKNLFRC